MHVFRENSTIKAIQLGHIIQKMLLLWLHLGLE